MTRVVGTPSCDSDGRQDGQGPAQCSLMVQGDALCVKRQTSSRRGRRARQGKVTQAGRATLEQHAAELYTNTRTLAYASSATYNCA